MVHKIGGMRNIIFAALLFVFFSPAISQVYIDPGIGAVFKDNTGNLSPRFNIGAQTLFSIGWAYMGHWRLPGSLALSLFLRPMNGTS